MHLKFLSEAHLIHFYVCYKGLNLEVTYSAVKICLIVFHIICTQDFFPTTVLYILFILGPIKVNYFLLDPCHVIRESFIETIGKRLGIIIHVLAPFFGALCVLFCPLWHSIGILFILSIDKLFKFKNLV